VTGSIGTLEVSYRTDHRQARSRFRTVVCGSCFAQGQSLLGAEATLFFLGEKWVRSCSSSENKCSRVVSLSLNL
jgi:hypothetical protein